MKEAKQAVELSITATIVCIIIFSLTMGTKKYVIQYADFETYMTILKVCAFGVISSILVVGTSYWMVKKQLVQE